LKIVGVPQASRSQQVAALIIYLLLVTGGLSLLFRGWSYDDPFISYRYADNIIRGLGMVYNPGERILSTTTPLFTLLLASLHSLWADLHDLAILIGAFSLAMGGLCLWDLANTSGLRFGCWVALLFYPTFPLLVSTLSAETALYLALCMGTFVSYQRKHYRLCAVIAALAVLARPDALIVAGLLTSHYLLTHRPGRGAMNDWLSCLPWQAAGLFALLLLPWVIFTWVYFGSPIPVSLYAKQQQAILEASTSFMPGIFTIFGSYRSWHYVIAGGMALVGWLIGLRRVPPLRWLTAWAGLYFLSFTLLGVTRYFWYYAPLIPAFILALGAGFDGMGVFLRRKQNAVTSKDVTGVDRRNPFTLTARYFPGLLMALLLAAQLEHLWQVRLTPDSRFPIYHAAGQWLNAHSMPDATVGTLEVGIIGYYSERPMVDFSGLIQPEIATQLGQTGSYAATANWAFDRYHPDYLVLQQGLFPDLEQAAIPTDCQPMVTYPGAVYGYAYDLGIFACP